MGGTVSIASGATLAGVLSENYGTGVLGVGSLTLAGSYAAKISKTVSGSTAVAGTDYDQIRVTGTVDVTGGNLQLLIGSGGEMNDIYYIISNDGTDAITGTFTTLNGVSTTLTEGSTFILSGLTYEITYLADYDSSSFTGGNDLALMVVAIPEPSIMIFMSLGLLICGMWNIASRRSVKLC